ncbi:RNA-directed DNA polymerase-like protein [Cucumis melo var. makuwa]|uniref:RNA-directed DNA polymerase-like protein n=1 Tax=Cucumis melo var. makuwa TaxID=1194695 RepID=A0A5D3CCN5_CUCMM|nr:RNA-directed DNA polymerase-like protein [Cucumis melo var. makuwa]TYK08984.1 RNA-directed DNA polymerase-like protein [Cucumis melo var. makuwa]
MKVVNSAALPIVGLVKRTMTRNGVSTRTSAMQLKKGVALDELTFMAILLDSLENPGETVSKNILMIDHEIELLPGKKLPTKNAYRMTPPELAEL